MREPLAARLRPRSLDEVLGQAALLGVDGPLRPWIAGGTLPSLVLYGPPGSGKTTIGRLLAEAIGAPFLTLNATTDGVAELRKRLSEADELARAGIRPVLFLDEIHRFSKSQQDGLLSAVEGGRVTLIGATTESPWAGAVIPALLSRLTALRLVALEEADLRSLLARGSQALAKEGLPAIADDDAQRNLIGLAAGDGRRLLTLLEGASAIARGESRQAIGARDALRAAQSRAIDYDRSGVISALIKSIRGGDRQAALYWLAVAIEAGEDQRYLARRLLIAAAEEVGAADPLALPMAAAALETAERIGEPETHYALAAVTAYLAGCPRDWSPGSELHARRDEIRADGPRPVPGHLRPGSKSYRHPADGAADDQRYLPEGTKR